MPSRRHAVLPVIVKTLVFNFVFTRHSRVHFASWLELLYGAHETRERGEIDVVASCIDVTCPVAHSAEVLHPKGTDAACPADWKDHRKQRSLIFGQLFVCAVPENEWGGAAGSAPYTWTPPRARSARATCSVQSTDHAKGPECSSAHGVPDGTPGLCLVERI